MSASGPNAILFFLFILLALILDRWPVDLVDPVGPIGPVDPVDLVGQNACGTRI